MPFPKILSRSFNSLCCTFTHRLLPPPPPMPLPHRPAPPTSYQPTNEVHATQSQAIVVSNKDANATTRSNPRTLDPSPTPPSTPPKTLSPPTPPIFAPRQKTKPFPPPHSQRPSPHTQAQVSKPRTNIRKGETRIRNPSVITAGRNHTTPRHAFEFRGLGLMKGKG
ncbi:hypothetical protein CC80DRAFT_505645 [Byssothecium circinans]|uniref:Uncharacterized protein n=1 Tax=Byssothecium circinans TaxID=147558 RepID=A0A6A5TSB9_9PLEO|nr:hypothetical protein CC80DRAFT_505645 [Byssothecium circinans]